MCDSCSNHDPKKPMDSNLLVKVYLPARCINSISGWCIGVSDLSNEVIVVTNIKSCKKLNKNDRIIGTWNYFCDKIVAEKSVFSLETSDLSVILQQYHFNDVPVCKCKLNGEEVSDVLLIIFNDGPNRPFYFNSENILGKRDREVRNDSPEKASPVNIALQVYSKYRNEVRETEVRVDSSIVRRIITQFMSVLKFPLRLFWMMLLLVLSSVELMDDAVRHLPGVQKIIKILQIPTVTKQLRSKYLILKHVAFIGINKNPSVADIKNKDIVANLRTTNMICGLIVDLVLGWLVCLSFQYLVLWSSTSKWLIVGTSVGHPLFVAHKGRTKVVHEAIRGGYFILLQKIASMLQQLIHSLMGAPVGLKLNSALAHFLGNFFLYQSLLWTGYLNFLFPVLHTIIWCMSLCGCGGLSVLLAVASDVISLMTFHVYCFYVYAAKIFMLQTSALFSLFRLFRGKKWNPLRSRVDSCSFEVDQLFIGTLLFTILLFLLPTTMLFYIVFTSLRIMVLFIQSFMKFFMRQLNTFPWYTVVNGIVGRSPLVDGVEFRNVEHTKSQPCVIMELKAMSLMRAYQLSLPEKEESSYWPGWSQVIKNVMTGRLIYPWGGWKEEQK